MPTDAEALPGAGTARASVGSRPHCRVCQTEVTTAKHSTRAEPHPQMETVVLRGVRHFVGCPGSGVAVQWLLPTTEDADAS